MVGQSGLPQRLQNRRSPFTKLALPMAALPAKIHRVTEKAQLAKFTWLTFETLPAIRFAHFTDPLANKSLQIGREWVSLASQAIDR